MFYSTFVLTKKGPLAKVWLAAHMHTKLTKAMVIQTDISSSCEQIVQPQAPMALRLSSNLMLGIVRIFSKKMRYLCQESEDAMTRVRLAFGREGLIGDGIKRRRGRGKEGIDLVEEGKEGKVDLYQIGEVWDIAGDAGVGVGDGTGMGILMNGGSGFKANEGDITINEWADGAGVGGDGVVDAFALEQEEERMEDLVYASQEPLIFTPQRAREISEGGSSIEVFRSTAVPSAESPHLNLSPQVTDDSGNKGKMISVSDIERDLTQGKKGKADETIPVRDGAERDTPMQKIIETEDVGPAPRFSAGSSNIGPEDDGIGVGKGIELDKLDYLEMEQEGPGANYPKFSVDGGEKSGVADEGDANAGVTTEGVETPRKNHAEVDAGGEKGGRRARKRRIAEIADVIDTETELPSMFIRAGLADTSDIVLAPNTKRREIGPTRRRGREQGPELLLANLVPGLSESEELGAIFRECYRPTFDLVSGKGKLGDRHEYGADGPNSGEDDAVVPQGDGDNRLISTGGCAPPLFSQDEEPFPGVATPPSKQASSVQPHSHSQHLSPDSAPPMSEILQQSLSSSLPQPLASVQQTGFTPTPAIPNDTDGRKSLTESGDVTLEAVADTAAAVSSDEVADGDSISVRTQKMGTFLKRNCTLEECGATEQAVVNYSAKIRQERDVSRRTVARTFYELLNLANRDYVSLHQKKAYTDIRVRPKENFDVLFNNSSRG